MADSKPRQEESDNGSPPTSEPLCEYCRKSDTSMGDPAFTIDKSLCQCSRVRGQSNVERDQGASSLEEEDENRSTANPVPGPQDETMADSKPDEMNGVEFVMSMLDRLCGYCKQYQIGVDYPVTFNSSLCQCIKVGAEPMYDYDDTEQSLEKSMLILRRDVRLMTRHTLEQLVKEADASQASDDGLPPTLLDARQIGRHRLAWGQEFIRLLQEVIDEFVKLRDNYQVLQPHSNENEQQ